MTNGFLTYLIDLSPYYLACAVIGYLIGSIPFGYIMVRLIKGIDIRTVGSGNIGATNVARVLGVFGGIICFLLDAAKGFFATALVPSLLFYKFLYGLFPIPEWAQTTCGTCTYFRMQRVLGGYLLPYGVIVGLFVILGHLYPVYLRFRGGKGVATGLGAFLVIAPYSTLIALVTWLISFISLRYVSLASIMAVISLPISSLFINNSLWRSSFPLHENLFIIIACCIIAGLVILRHIPNIKRLIKGTEPKVRLWRKQ